MTLPLTAKRIAATYECLRSFPPFCRWSLPSAEQITFQVMYSPHTAADYTPAAGERIRVSANCNGLFSTLAMTVAHEMVHQYLKQRGRKHWYAHGDEFKRIARVICTRFGWDPKTF